MTSPMHTVVDRLRQLAQGPDMSARLSYLIDGEDAVASMTYRELDHGARSLAAILDDRGCRGERVLVVAPPGLDYLTAIFGGFYAGATVVPAFPPEPGRKERSLLRFRVIAKDSRARFAVAPRGMRDAFADASNEAERLSWIDLEDIPEAAAATWRERRPARDALALLQYTSGSTSEPRGVMITHGNLAANTAVFAEPRFFDLAPSSVVVSWVPLFHDLGLVSMFLAAVSAGCSFVHLHSAHFAQDPLRWLRAIARHRGTHTAAPNFAYELCLRRATGDALANLDLRSLHVAMNGAEPARVDTMQRFAERFARSGLDPRALVHHYGMAEHTAFIAGTGRGADLGGSHFDPAALASGRAAPAAAAGPRTTLPSLGAPPEHLAIRIVDPATSHPVPPGTVGEIWIAGPSVGAGYFERPEETATTFRARVEGDAHAYLRTGDLGFFHGRELFHAGRRKDLIIVHGANHYPQDIERIVERADPMVRPGSVAAFEIDGAGGPGVGVVAEVVQSPLPAGAAERVLASVRSQIAAGEGLPVQVVALVRPGTSLKTTSGKIQRSATRQSLFAGTLALEAIWRDTGNAPPSPAPPVSAAEPEARWSYEIVWERSPPPPPSSARHGAWIVVSDRGGVNTVLERSFRDRGARAIVLAPWAIGAEAARVPDPAMLCRAISDAASAAAEVHGVIVLSALDLPRNPGHGDGGAAMCRGVQAVADLVATRGLGKIVVVTRGAQRWDRTPVVMAHAALWGTSRALCFDQPQHPCTLIDLDPSPNGDEAHEIAASVLAETDEPELVVRGGQRYVPRLRPATSRAAPGADDLDRRPLSPGVHAVGVFDLALGLHLAHWLTTRGARHLVLLTGSPEEPALLGFVRAQRQLGVTVEVADPERAMQAPWFASVRGVVLTLGDRAETAGGLSLGLGKLAALDAAFGAHRGLELFATCSRAVGMLGAPAARDEAALAAAMDAIAERRLASSLAATALSLGPVAEDEVHAAQLTSAGIRFARHAEVVDAMLAALRGGPEAGSAGGARIVLPFDLAALLDLLPAASDRPMFRSLAAPAAHALRDRRTSVPGAYVGPRNEVERVLAEMVAAALRVDRIGIDDSFFSLGGDSILATDLLSKVNTRFGVAMAPRQLESLFERFTVRAMASLVHQALVSRIAGMTAGEIESVLDKTPEA